MICKLSDIVNTANTGADAIKKAPILNEPTNLRCLRIGDVSQKRDFSMWGYTKTSKMDYERYKLHKGDSIIARTGNTIGVCTYIEDDIESVYNNGLIRLTAKKELARERFLFYLIRSTACQDYIQSIAYGTSTQPNMKIKDFLNFDIIVPTLEIQDKIIAIVDKIEKKIQVNTEINNNLEQQAQAIFLKMFPDIFSTSASSSFQNLIEFSNGKKRPEAIGDIPVYGGNGILAYTNQSNAENCVIIGRVGAYCGNTFLCSEKCWISDNAIQAKSKNEDSQLFIYYLLRNASLPSRHIGTGQPLMTQAILNAVPVNEPSTQEIRSFINVCTPLHEIIFTNEKQNISLTLLRDTLLPKLMSGELDVSDIDL